MGFSENYSPTGRALWYGTIALQRRLLGLHRRHRRRDFTLSTVDTGLFGAACVVK